MNVIMNMVLITDLLPPPHSRFLISLTSTSSLSSSFMALPLLLEQLPPLLPEAQPLTEPLEPSEALQFLVPTQAALEAPIPLQAEAQVLQHFLQKQERELHSGFCA